MRGCENRLPFPTTCRVTRSTVLPLSVPVSAPAGSAAATCAGRSTACRRCSTWGRSTTGARRTPSG